MRRALRHRSPAAGFSLPELAIVMAILGLMLGGMGMVLQTSNQAFSAGSASMKLEGQGNRALGQIVDTLRAAQGATLVPAPAPPASSPQIDFQRSLGAQPGGVLLGNTQRLRLVAGQGRIELVEDLGLPSERSIVLCRNVPDLLAGEVVNNLDDNGNGLVDETGLCFSVEDDVVRVLLTLSTAGAQGSTLTSTFEARLFARN